MAAAYLGFRHGGEGNTSLRPGVGAEILLDDGLGIFFGPQPNGKFRTMSSASCSYLQLFSSCYDPCLCSRLAFVVAIVFTLLCPAFISLLGLKKFIPMLPVAQLAKK